MGRHFQAMRALSDLATDAAWLRVVVDYLSSIEPRASADDHQVENKEDLEKRLRYELDARAGELPAPENRQVISDLISSLIDAFLGNPRLSWLAKPLSSNLKKPDLDTPITVAVLGEFSAGKSRLLNALLKRRILATGIVPVTASVTRIGFSPDAHVDVTFSDRSVKRVGLEELPRYTDERKGAKSSELVEEVRVDLPEDLLRECELIDTPGFNSGFSLHDQTAASIVLRADVILWVFSAQQTGSESEWRELRHIRRATGRCYAVVNKIDDLDNDTESLEEVLKYLRRHTEEIFEDILPVSAKWIEENHPRSGERDLVEVIRGIRRAAQELKKAAVQRRRQELARKELARRSLAEEERQCSQRAVGDASSRLDTVKEQWEEALEAERSAAPALGLTGLEPILRAVYESPPDSFPDNDLIALLETWQAAERHSFILDSGLADDWRAIVRVLLDHEQSSAQPCFWGGGSGDLTDSSGLFRRLCHDVDRAISTRYTLESLLPPENTPAYLYSLGNRLGVEDEPEKMKSSTEDKGAAEAEPINHILASFCRRCLGEPALQGLLRTGRDVRTFQTFLSHLEDLQLSFTKGGLICGPPNDWNRVGSAFGGRTWVAWRMAVALAERYENKLAKARRQKRLAKRVVSLDAAEGDIPVPVQNLICGLGHAGVVGVFVYRWAYAWLSSLKLDLADWLESILWPSAAVVLSILGGFLGLFVGMVAAYMVQPPLKYWNNRRRERLETIINSWQEELHDLWSVLGIKPTENSTAIPEDQNDLSEELLFLFVLEWARDSRWLESREAIQQE